MDKCSKIHLVFYKELILIIFDVFTTREISTAIYIILLIVFCFSSNAVRPCAINLIKTVCNKTILITFCCIVLYAVALSYGFHFFHFWNSKLIKDISVWVLFVGVPVCFNATNREIGNGYFYSMVVDNLKFSVVVEFLLTTFTFSFIKEMIFQFVATFFIVLQSYTGVKNEYEALKKKLDFIVSCLGIAFLIATFNVAKDTYMEYDFFDLLIEFCIPIVFSACYLPVAYLLCLYSRYQLLFIRIFPQNKKDKKTTRIKRRKILLTCGLSLNRLQSFQESYHNHHIHPGVSIDNFIDFIDSFKKETMT